MSLSAFLDYLSLSNYLAVFTNKGYTELEQFLSLSEPDLEAALVSLAMLKGHAFKFKKALESVKKGEAPPIKRPHVDAEPAGNMVPKPGLMPAKPGVPKTVSNSLVKEVEKLISKLRDIESVKEDIARVRGLVLAVDLDRYRRGLAQMEGIQKSMKDMELPGEDMQE